MTKPIDSEAFFDAVLVCPISPPFHLRSSLAHPFQANSKQNRRSYYALTNKPTISDSQLTDLVQRSVKHAPNPFMMQETRAVIITGEHYHKLWEMVRETYKLTLGNDRESDTLKLYFGATVTEGMQLRN